MSDLNELQISYQEAIALHKRVFETSVRAVVSSVMSAANPPSYTTFCELYREAYWALSSLTVDEIRGMFSDAIHITPLEVNWNAIEVGPERVTSFCRGCGEWWVVSANSRTDRDDQLRALRLELRS